MSFEKDLEFGNKYERRLVKILPHESYHIMEGYYPDYDVEITHGNTTTKYEVKADRFAYKTFNIVIEFEYKGRPSGINVTTSDYYAYFICKPYNLYELLLIPTDYIREVINTNQYKKILEGGDGNQSKMYVLDRKLFNGYKYIEVIG